MIREAVKSAHLAVVCNLIAGRTCENCVHHGQADAENFECAIGRHDQMIDSCIEWVKQDDEASGS